MDTIHFWRTISFGETINLDILEILKKVSGTNFDNFETDLKNLFSIVNSETKLNQNYLEMLCEIQAIEMKKFRLRDVERTIEKVFREDIRLSAEREKLLLMDHKSLNNIRFILNPMVEIYESFWEWTVKESRQKSFNLENVLKEGKGDYYFLFERTGVYDQWLDTNVFEYPLTQYQYFLLQLFGEEREIQSVTNEFIETFDTFTLEEEQELLILTRRLIKEHIFKKHIIRKY
ncbi:hypothetical protein [Ulvibacterium sp.]|uniref:hypothetical protein n=1 Tax=Ulvibacterium sp. TaxID=2665914 RepID=UPI002618BA90|nr:hypothetical protein [Ulvibacterium sp.]